MNHSRTSYLVSIWRNANDDMVMKMPRTVRNVRKFVKRFVGTDFTVVADRYVRSKSTSVKTLFVQNYTGHPDQNHLFNYGKCHSKSQITH